MRRLVLTNKRGLTLVELMVALAIISVISTAVTALLTGAAKTNAFVNTQTDAVSQAEIALRRIMHNLRTTSAINSPTDTTAANSLTVVTQPDSSNGNTSYTVTYALSGTNLTESDARYNGSGNTPNTIASNVRAFSVTRSLSPQTVTVTLTVGTSSPVTRTMTVFCRNL